MADMIEMRSDTFTLPTEQMVSAMTQAVLGDDVYGEDPTANRLEELAAKSVGKPAACLMPSGTMANLAALLVHVPRGGKVLVGNESDIYLYEAGGASVCGGVVYEPIPTRPDGTLALDDLAAAFPPDPDDPQFALPGLICVENTHNRMGGRVLSQAYLAELRRFATGHGIPVHMDGARIFNAAVATGVPAEQIAAHADSIQFCLSKGLSAPIGSILAGEADFIEKARRIRKMLGGGMRQAGVFAAAGLVALTSMIDRLAEDHQRAAQLAAGLAEVDGIDVDPGSVTTNIVLFRVTANGLDDDRFLHAIKQRGLVMGEFGHGRIRAVTHRGLSAADVSAAVAIVADVVREAS
ncbi:threonine aldolase [Streptomyces viridochromogenes]|uniref:Threonine aldolase n=2 Tax=Streptomyces viridochromogenes TaxID=1938 RepID=A0A0J7ZMA0_STRVR|nr:threonine aldolase [Streptomyces viridochromogenes]KOG25057.1 threonine aldolase [Streptomyces viridochromogenes]KOG26524.1 threonine aldolase [Streptomyces viridochromogenes]